MRKFWWIIILLLLLTLGAYIITLFITVGPCLDDCNTICNPELKCCYQQCVSSGCNGHLAKDLDYYQKRGYTTGTLGQWADCKDQLP